MRHLTLDDGERLEILVRGHGPAVVLLHGWSAEVAIWSRVVDALAADHTVYAWTARGHGTPRPGAGGGHAPPTAARMACDLAAVIAHYRLERPTLVGHSMGALVAWQFVADHGLAALGKLCVIDQSPKLVTDADWRLGIYGDWSAGRDAAFVADLRQDFAETVLRLICLGRNDEARRQYEADSAGVRRLRDLLRRRAVEPHITCWQSLSAADYRPVLPALALPVLLVYGGASNYYGSETVRYVAGRIPAADLHVFENADHSPQLTDPGRFVALLQNFIKAGT